MAHQHRTGPTEWRQFPVKLASGATGNKSNTIQPGDLLAYETANGQRQLVPVASFTWTTDQTTTSDNFAAAFAGVASGRSLADSAHYADLRDTFIPVIQDGDVEFDCASATYLVDTYIRPSKDTGSNLKNLMEATTDVSTAVAVVVRTTSASSTRVLARLLKTSIKRQNNV